MKKFIILFAALSLTIYFGCSNNLVSPLLNSTSGGGKVMLKISSDSIPGSVVKVTAILSKSGEDTLTESVVPLSNTSASIGFTNVPAGTWNLKVNALDSDSNIVYTGETDIQVNAGIVTQVSLTLIPTGQGKGNIEISVTWGQNTSGWIDYNANPIFTRYDSPTMPNGVGEAVVMLYQNKFRMWYLNLYDAGMTNVWYAESSNGYNWENVGGKAVLTAGTVGTWDDFKVAPGAVIRDSNEYKMYFIGMRDQYGAWRIGLAVSTDGINWQKYPYPVLDTTYNEFEIAVHSVLKVNGKYYMYYDSSPSIAIYLATSVDGIHWTRNSSNPILAATKIWENGGVSYPSVIYENGEFKMIYDSKDHNGFGYATSTDGIHWVKDASNPIFTAGNTSNNWASKVAYPYFNKFGNQYRLYYTGSYYSNEIKIGVAFKM